MRQEGVSLSGRTRCLCWDKHHLTELLSHENAWELQERHSLTWWLAFSGDCAHDFLLCFSFSSDFKICDLCTVGEPRPIQQASQFTV